MIKDIQISKHSIIFIILFPFLPFISSLLFAIFVAFYPKINKTTFYLFFTLLSIYLGLINATKVPESDLLKYYDLFFLVKDTPFLTYILLAGKEPVFFLFNYVIYFLINGSIHFYLIITTSIGYLFLFVAIFKLFKAINASKNILVFAIILAAFFPQLFGLSAHLIRQFIAASILIYAIVQKIFYQKNVWLYLFLAVFIHSSSLFFAPLLFLDVLKVKLKFKTIIKIAMLFLAISIITPYLTKLFMNIMGNNFLTYVLNRLNEEAQIGEDPIGVLPFMVMGIMSFILLFLQFGKSKFKNEYITSGFFNLANIILLFFVFILANLSNTLIAKRFFFYTYFFFPLIFPLYLMSKNINLTYIRCVISSSMILFFIYRLQYGTWEYAPISQLLLGNIFNFFT